MKYHICREKMQLSRAKPGNPASINIMPNLEIYCNVDKSNLSKGRYKCYVTVFIWKIGHTHYTPSNTSG